MKKIKIYIILLTFLYPSFVFSGVTWVRFSDIAPTQINIGIVAMENKKDKIEEKYKKGNLEKYLKGKVAPAYLAEDGRYYIIDRHHTSRALYEANTPYGKYPVKVIADYSHLTMKDFLNRMNREERLFLMDNGVGPLGTSALPLSIRDTKDDPYRSLAWMVRKKGGFKKIDVPYLEFLWANFFRSRISIYGIRKRDLEKVLPKALKLARSKEAKDLPGYSSKGL